MRKTIRGLSRQLPWSAIQALAAGRTVPGHAKTKRRFADGNRLYAEVSKAATRKATWVWLANGCTIRVPIGPVVADHDKVESARRQAADLSAKFKEDGVNPRAARAVAKTVAAVVDDHLEKSSGLRKALTQARLASSLRRYITPIASKDAVKIDADAIEATFRPVLIEFPVQGRAGQSVHEGRQGRQSGEAGGG